MFGSAVLDVAIGIVLLFLFVSLICSALREAIEALQKSRALDLEKGIRELLHDRDGKGLTRQIYEHPFIYSLYAGSYEPTVSPDAQAPTTAPGKLKAWVAHRNLPAYIPSRNFSAALIDIIRQAQPGQPLDAASFRSGCATIASVPLRRAILAALDDAGDDLTLARRNIEGWYDATMDRVSGWYKRRTQGILLAIGFLAAAAFNIDAVNVAQHLAIDKSFRDAVVARAASLQTQPNPPAGSGQDAKTGGGTAAAAPDANDPPADIASALARDQRLRAELEGTGFALGWPLPQCTEDGAKRGCGIGAYMQIGLGWIITALAVSLGAPFWFDLLNKFMVVRSTVKPAEKSGQEASKDSWPPAASDGDGQLVPMMVVASPAGRGRGSGGTRVGK